MDLDTVILALRVVVALAAVLGALLLAHRWITKGRPGGPVRTKRIAVVARQGLGAKAGVAIVDADGRRYLLGVTEHAVTVLDTLGAVSTGSVPTLVSAQPIAPPVPDGPAVRAGRFAQELQTIAIPTGQLPVLVHGRTDPSGPRGPVTEALLISRPDADAGTTRRALREAEQRRAQQQGGPLAGSVLSPATWRQTFDALKRSR